MRADWSAEILEEIAEGTCTRDDVAQAYALCLRDCRERTDWPRINAAIIERWSPCALGYIKAKAWRLVREWAWLRAEGE